MILGAEAAQTARWLRLGTSVVVVGSRGTGRTSLVQTVVEDLERGGQRVVEIPTDRLVPAPPFGSLVGLGIVRAAPGAVVDALTHKLLEIEATVLVIDDAAWLDPESAAALAAARRRAGLPVLVTRTTASAESTAVHRWFPAVDSALVSLGPLTYEQSSELVHGLLDGPLEPDLIASIHAKSSGILSVVVAVVRSAVRAGTIARVDDVWELVGEDLWNEHLIPVVEQLLADVGQQDARTAYALALLGSMTMEQVSAAGLGRSVARLEDRGLVAFSGSRTSSMILTLRPLVLVDYFRHRLPDATGVLLASRLAPTLGLKSAEILRQATPGLDIPFAPGIPAPSELEYPARVRAFDDELDRERAVRSQRWAQEPSTVTALDYLTLLWETSDWQDEAITVLGRTDGLLEQASADELLVYTLIKGYLHVLLRRDPHEGARAVQWLSQRSPEFAVDSAAVSLFLHVVGVRDRDRDIAHAQELVDRRPGSWMAQFALLAALAVHGDAERAASLGDPPAGMPEVVVPYWQFFELLALLELDRYGDALDLARRGLADARAQFDRPRVYLFTYALAHCLFRMGHWAQATTLISETLALGSPASHSSPGQASYEALLRMGALLMFLSGHRRAAASLLHGVTGSADGPMAWMQQATGDAIRALMDGDEVGAADHLTRGGRDSGLRGYGVGQRVSYLYAMWFDPTLERLDRLDAVSAASSSPERHGPFRRYLRAVLEHPASIATVAGDYESFEDLPLAVLVTRRLASRAADPSAREAAERAAELLADRLGRDLQETPRVAADPALLLTDREFEVALLVGARSNSQIAVSLQLSRRTVENHVHRALKKTGAQTREELTLIAGRSRHRR